MCRDPELIYFSKPLRTDQGGDFQHQVLQQLESRQPASQGARAKVWFLVTFTVVDQMPARGVQLFVSRTVFSSCSVALLV